MGEHTLLILFTCGLYLPVFLMLVVLHYITDPFLCPSCGWKIERPGSQFFRRLTILLVWFTIVSFAVGAFVAMTHVVDPPTMKGKK